MDDEREIKAQTLREAVVAWIVTMAMVLIILAIAHIAAHARDIDGKYAKANPELHSWFESLTSDQGYCCAEADGFPLEDGDWDSQGEHYWANIPSNLFAPRSSDPKWVEVPDNALVKQHNKIGHAMVWLYNSGDGIKVRCFMPGTEG
jgi:hypothetical protein